MKGNDVTSIFMRHGSLSPGHGPALSCLERFACMLCATALCRAASVESDLMLVLDRMLCNELSVSGSDASLLCHRSACPTSGLDPQLHQHFSRELQARQPEIPQVCHFLECGWCQSSATVTARALGSQLCLHHSCRIDEQPHPDLDAGRLCADPSELKEH